MRLTVKEMEMLCVMHSGTVSETLVLLRSINAPPPELAATVSSLIEKLSGLKKGEEPTLTFDPE